MITSKHITSIAAVAICFALLICGFVVYGAQNSDPVRIPEYQKMLFGEEVLTIDIQVDKDEWQSLLDNPITKEWIAGDLIIGGERFSTVGIRTKGNSSLMQMRGERYSLQFKANKYIKGQTFFGLDTFCVNNMMGDATYMKDYLSHDIMNFIGVAASLTNYAVVTVNGEDYGFMIALERYDRSFLERVYDTPEGQLYNVKIQMGMRGNFEDMRQDLENIFPGRGPGGGGMDFGGRNPWGGGEGDFGMPGGMQPWGGSDGMPEMQPWGGSDGMPEMQPWGGSDGFPEMPPWGGNSGDAGLPEMPPWDGSEGLPEMQPGSGRNFDGRGQEGGMNFPGRGPGGGMGMGGFGRSGGGSLVYTDDDIGSYGAIFDNAVFNNNTDNDKQKVITAIRNLNTGTDLEKYFDVDGILRYFAAHTVVVNLDSYISNMQQNYYLYEHSGKITILPWDYNLAFGAFQSGNASSVVNFPIDTPVSGVSMEERPLLNKLLEVDEYRQRYHEYLRQIVEGYFESGLYEKTISSLNAKINEYVKNDASAFFTHEQYEASLPHLLQLGLLRAESIKGQLRGEIPSTSMGQIADNSALIDASSVNLSALGSMMGGGGGMNRGGWQGGDRVPGETIPGDGREPGDWPGGSEGPAMRGWGPPPGFSEEDDFPSMPNIM